MGVNTSEKIVNLFSVPDQMLELLVESVMDDSLSISWKRPAQPNDYTLNYAVSVTDISTARELNRTVLNETQIIVTLHLTPCMGRDAHL